MTYRKGFTRLWLVLSLLWLVAGSVIVRDQTPYPLLHNLARDACASPGLPKLPDGQLDFLSIIDGAQLRAYQDCIDKARATPAYAYDPAQVKQWWFDFASLWLFIVAGPLLAGAILFALTLWVAAGFAPRSPSLAQGSDARVARGFKAKP